MIRIEVEEVIAKDLQPGDLFSTATLLAWQAANDPSNPPLIGEKVYIRTNNPLPEDQEEHVVTRVTIHHVDPSVIDPPDPSEVEPSDEEE